MTYDPQTVAWLDQEDARLAQLVRAHRFAVQVVGAGDAIDEPAFGYTIGLFGLGHPELAVVGLGAHGPADDLLTCAAGLVVEGRDLLPGELLGVPRPDAAVVEELPNPGEVVLGANRFYRRPPEFSVPVLQLTWAHPDGRFPWDAGYACDPGCQPRPGTWRA